MSATVTRQGSLDMQVCVPEDWTDTQALEFAERNYPCGTTLGWQMRHRGDDSLGSDPERQPCNQYTGYVHISFDA